MKYEEVSWYSERLNKEMRIKIYGLYGLDVEEENKLKYYDVVLKHEQDFDSMLPYIDID